MEIPLTILAQDIKETNYMDSSDCAITRALSRAGLSNYWHAGTSIREPADEGEDRDILCTENNSNLRVLSTEVWNMYLNKSSTDLNFILKIEENGE